jgi:hypothetical protein
MTLTQIGIRGSKFPRWTFPSGETANLIVPWFSQQGIQYDPDGPAPLIPTFDGVPIDMSPRLPRGRCFRVSRRL